MAFNPDSRLDHLWQEYSLAFHDFDDLTLARWLAQTLGQLEGRAWRLSHPLLGAYRLAAQLAHQRQVWLKRLATPPAAYAEAPCCRAPLLPLLTRDVRESGLLCQHCNETLVPFEEIPSPRCARNWKAGPPSMRRSMPSPIGMIASVKPRATTTRPTKTPPTKPNACSARPAAPSCPNLSDDYPAAVWEDQDECLSVQPEDIEL